MLIVLNNKCNLTKKEFISYQNELENIDLNSNKLVLCPSSPYLSLYNLNNISLGAQNVSKEEMGAFTGEVSSSQLKSLNVQYTIIGHSERRNKLNETNDEINLKIKLLLKDNIIPILCLGESLEEKLNNKTKEVIEQELLEGLKDLTEEETNKLIIAYEPIWAIGTGKIPTVEEIDYVLNIIKTHLPNNTLLYGGSANTDNIVVLNKSHLINGYLLGGLSLKTVSLQEFIYKMN